MSSRVIAFFAVLAGGCAASMNMDMPDDPQADLEQWNQLVAQLDARRSEFLGTHVQDLAASGNQLFWVDNTSLSFKLRRYDHTTAARVSYSFAVGDANTFNYRASPALVVTAAPVSDPVVYRVFDANQANTAIDTLTMPRPPNAQWSAYAVSAGMVYIVDTSTADTTKLLRWVPGQAPTQVTTLESAGAEIGEFQDFDITDDTMIFIESGRIWKLDLGTNHATWLMNKTEVSGTVDYRSDGVMFTAATGILFFDYARNALVDVTAKINANPFKVNATFGSAAKYLQNFARWKNFVLYIGNGGLFAYDMTADKITPIVLSPNSGNLRVDYRYPVVLDDGTAFVTGLTSTSGATGADGPTYKIDLATLL